MSNEFDLEQGEIVWQVFTKLFKESGDAGMLPKIEMMVKTMGAEITYEMCNFSKAGIPKNVKKLAFQAMQYLENKYKKESAKN